mmetsp:Transcript_26301/g.88408  ORF Transcript_26301/g.88408 Transcript_26301/m.88408 type:complete len:311 (-) Transcript_26301:314-1246(-)
MRGRGRGRRPGRGRGRVGVPVVDKVARPARAVRREHLLALFDLPLHCPHEHHGVPPRDAPADLRHLRLARLVHPVRRRRPGALGEVRLVAEIVHLEKSVLVLDIRVRLFGHQLRRDPRRINGANIDESLARANHARRDGAPAVSHARVGHASRARDPSVLGHECTSHRLVGRVGVAALSRGAHHAPYDVEVPLHRRLADGGAGGLWLDGPRGHGELVLGDCGLHDAPQRIVSFVLGVVPGKGVETPARLLLPAQGAEVRPELVPGGFLQIRQERKRAEGPVHPLGDVREALLDALQMHRRAVVVRRRLAH